MGYFDGAGAGASELPAGSTAQKNGAPSRVAVIGNKLLTSS